MEQEIVRHGAPRGRVTYLPFPGLESTTARSDRVPLAALFVGRMTRVKGVDLLIDAAYELKSKGLVLQLELAGDGPERPSLEGQATRYGLNAKFHGWVSDEKKQQLFERAGVLVVPSTWPEPFGLVGLEAAAYGIPAVAFDVGGVREWLRPGESGELAPANPPTAKGLAAAILKVVANPNRWRALADGTRAAKRPEQQAHLRGLEELLKAAQTQTQ